MKKTLWILFILCGVVFGQASEQDGASAPKDDAPRDEQLTPAEVLENVKTSMQRFAAVEYSASIDERRQADALIGKYRFLSDGQRWLADERSFRVDVSQKATVPDHRISGFDGDTYFQFDEDLSRLFLGSDSLANRNLEPQRVFWRGGLSMDWLLSALKSPTARIDGNTQMHGQSCLVIVSEPTDGWRFELTFSPQHSWLPVKSVIQLQGKPYGHEAIEELAQMPDGTWYPKKISWEQVQPALFSGKKDVRITDIKLRSDFRDDEFRYGDSLPLNCDIVDFRRSRAWHNDPWWSDLKPWLEENCHWPRPMLSELRNLQSYCDVSIQGQAAPEIEAAEWINGNPGSWQREGRKMTILLFAGGHAVAPLPGWMAGIKGLAEEYAGNGLDVVCVFPANIELETARRTIRALDISFPVAIDVQDESNVNGATHNAFRMQSYLGVVLVDFDEKVQVLGGTEQQVLNGLSEIEYLIRQQRLAATEPAEEPRPDVVPGPPELTRADLRLIENEWKRLRVAKPGDWRLWVLLKYAEPSPDGPPATLKVIPELKLLHSDRPGGWTILHDDAWMTSSDEGFDLFGLPKGSYIVTVTRPGFATIERRYVLPEVDNGNPNEIPMTAGDFIRARVVDERDQPIAGASVTPTGRHIDPNRPAVWTTAHLPNEPVVTDPDGGFSFAALYEGSYALTISANGYEPQSVLIPVGTEGRTITLKPTTNGTP